MDIGTLLASDCYIIAEIGQAHDGSLGNLYALSTAAISAGADAVKVQIHLADYESSQDDEFRVGTWFPQDARREDYWRRMSFSPNQWDKYFQTMASHGIPVGVSCFSVEAVDLVLDSPGAPAFFKIASGEVDNDELVEAMFAEGRPVIISTGMSTWDEIRSGIVPRLRDLGYILNVDYAMLQCTSEYPAQPENLDLNAIGTINDEACLTGYSDHTGSPYAGIYARSKGARIIEAHICWDKAQYGPDTPASLTVDEFETMVDGVRWVARAESSTRTKDEISLSLSDTRRLFGRSAYTQRRLGAGSYVQPRWLKPGGGISADDWRHYRERTLRHDVDEGHRLTPQDFHAA